MKGFNFSWDLDKAQKNQTKHGVSFNEAATVFDDPLGIRIDDVDHSISEDLFLFLGCSWVGRCLVEIHTYSEFPNRIRIISARKAKPWERRTYERQDHEG